MTQRMSLLDVHMQFLFFYHLARNIMCRKTNIDWLKIDFVTNTQFVDAKSGYARECEYSWWRIVEQGV